MELGGTTDLARQRRERTTRTARTAFAVSVLGLPLWWVLGLVTVVPILLAVPLARDLLHRRRVLLPPGSGWWLLFLTWIALGVGVLWAVAPDTTSGGSSGRLLVFGLRAGWYVSCTVAMLWVGNTSRELLPDRTVYLLFGWLFVVTTCGGLLGVVAPDLTIPTLLQVLLPHSVSSNAFVAPIVSAQTADVQSVLGSPLPRPKAPFPFANTWGAMMALSLVFLVAAMTGLRRRVKLPTYAVVPVAAVPIVYSLDRGLWITLAIGGVAILVVLALHGRLLAVVTLTAVVLVGGSVLASGPLGAMYSSRIDHPHSNDRRMQLLTTTVVSTTVGSPVVGFGSTRNLQGSFASIAGASTPRCPACGVPPLGTQGQLWLVIFTQGWLGLAFFLVFLLLALARSWRCRTVNETVAAFAIAFFLIELPVYDTLGWPMLLVMVAIGLAWRESRDQVPAHGVVTVVRRPRRQELTVLAGTALIGAALAIGVVLHQEPAETGSVTVELTPTPSYLDVGPTAHALADPGGSFVVPTPVTVDTEAALLRSDAALSGASEQLGLSTAQLESMVSLSAAPLSDVLTLTARTAPDENATRVARSVAASYLAERRLFLDHSRRVLRSELERRLSRIDPLDPALAGERAYLRAAADYLAINRPQVGRIVGHVPSAAVPPQRAVPVTSGLALGLLGGAAVLRLRARHRS